MLIAITLASKADGKEVTRIYLKNNGVAPADIWVNGAYQGYVPGGEICSVDKLGFTTYDSGRTNSIGTKSADMRSHGGWSGHDDTIVSICQCKNKQPYKMTITIPKEWGTQVGNAIESPKVWFGETSAGNAPTDSEIQNQAKEIYKAIEADDCVNAAQIGVIDTNAKSALINFEWRVFRKNNVLSAFIDDGTTTFLPNGSFGDDRYRKNWKFDGKILTFSFYDNCFFSGKLSSDGEQIIGIIEVPANEFTAGYQAPMYLQKVHKQGNKSDRHF